MSLLDAHAVNVVRAIAASLPHPLVLCDSVDVGVDCMRQLSMDGGDLGEALVADSIGLALAQSIVEAGATRCGVLPVPDAGYESVTITHRSSGLSVRVVRMYDIQRMKRTIRYDVLVGS
jgi:hypothetical protein